MKITRFDARPFIPASHEDPADPGVWKKVLLAGADLPQGIMRMVNWALLPAGKTFRSHYHEDMQEVFIIVRGRPRIIAGGERAQLGPGDGVVIPAGAVHTMEAPSGQEDVEYIALGISAGAGGKTVVV